ncbi:MAG: hypothetical protein U0746_09650 [Gemmataceae bacterium]
MEGEWLSVIDIANHHGFLRATVFKTLKKLGIETKKERSSPNGGQAIAYINQEDYQRVIARLAITTKRESDEEDGDGEEQPSVEFGVFYLIRLEPALDPGRFKVGFAASMPERLRQLRCSAPFASVIKTWPCRRLWEKTAIDSVAAGCERLHTEVFRAVSLDEVLARCDKFFAVMPALDNKQAEQDAAADGGGITAFPDSSVQ